MKSLKKLVTEHPDVFYDAVRESEKTLSALEVRLEISLPADVRWFWLNCGSGCSGAAPNAQTSITDTLRYRAAIGLPSRYVVLEDRHDAGSIFLDTTSGSVAWVDSHAVSDFAAGRALATEYDDFQCFVAWVEACVEHIED
jgi:hypothetical protein